MHCNGTLPPLNTQRVYTLTLYQESNKGSFTRCDFFVCDCDAENGLCGCQ